MNEYIKPVISRYTKDELPTWSEIYYNYWLNYDNANEYHDDEDIYELDKYWRIPKKLYLLGMVCNQLNKMISEDGIEITSLANGEVPSKDISSFFVLQPLNYDTVFNGDKAPIYTFKLPNGKRNPFIVNDDKRIEVNDYVKTSMRLILQQKYDMPLKGETISCSTYTMFKPIVEDILKEVINYFKDL